MKMSLNMKSKKFFLYDEINYNFEEIITCYTSSTKFDENHKIELFIEILKKVISVTDKYDYILQILGGLNPYEYFEEFKQIYNGSSDESLKSSILNALRKSILFSSFEKTNRLTNKQIATIVKIQLFIEGELKSMSVNQQALLQGGFKKGYPDYRVETGL